MIVVGWEEGGDDITSVHPAQISFRIVMYTESGLQAILGWLGIAV